MAYIQPNTRVLLLTGVPLDETYEHTLYFSDINAQTSYFLGQKKYEFSPQTYQRKGIGYIKVNQRPELLYDCSYLMFQNTSYGNKWFYAFVLDVEYVNDATAIISYQIDWLQTWWFDITIHKCWVDREHIAVDAIGANLQDEGLELGELVTENVEYAYSGTTENLIVVATTIKPARSTGTTVGSVFEDWNADVTIDAQYRFRIQPHSQAGFSAPIYLYAYDHEQCAMLQFMFDELSARNQIDGVIAYFLVPEQILEKYNQDKQPWFDRHLGATFLTDMVYTPKNAKLYQYPYNVLELTDCNGNSKVYRPELIPDQAVVARAGMALSPTAESFCYIKNYNNDEFVEDQLRERLTSFDAGMVSSALPQLPYSIDSYRVWLAQNSTWMGGHRVEGTEIMKGGDIIKSFANTGMAIGAGALAGSKFGPEGALLGGALSGIGALTNVGVAVHDGVSRKEQAKLLPDKFNNGTGCINVQLGIFGFCLFHKCIQADYAKRIDDFFEMFGYKTNELKIPNTHSRPKWNYVKTRMANITGNIPSTDLAKIKAIFNNGITFWKNPSEVGNYSLNNH